MHCSGTSAVIGALWESGVYLGQEEDVWPPDLMHEKGILENRLITALNNQVLSDNGGKWDDPPTRVSWSQERKQDRDQLIQTFSDRGIWGFKDPRNLLTLSGWQEALPSMQLVGVFRDPLRVISSLAKKENFSAEQSSRLWIRYNVSLIALYAEKAFPILSFDKEEDLVKKDLRLLALKLGLQPPEDMRFFESQLRKSDPAEVKIPTMAKEIYEVLQKISI